MPVSYTHLDVYKRQKQGCGEHSQHDRQEQAGQALKRQCVKVAKAIHVGAAPCNAASPLNRKMCIRDSL